MNTDKNSQITQSGTPAQPKQTVPDNNHKDECLRTPARISYERWLEKYRPIQNHLNSNSSFDGCMFETYGEELAFVCAQHDRTIWTLLDCDGEMRIAEGLHYVNRIGYFITEVAAPANKYFSIKAD